MSPTGDGSPVATESEPDSDLTPKRYVASNEGKPQKSKFYTNRPTAWGTSKHETIGRIHAPRLLPPPTPFGFQRLVQTNHGQSRNAVSCGSQGRWHGTMSALRDQDHDSG